MGTRARAPTLLGAAALAAGCGALGASEPDPDSCTATSMDPRRYKLLDIATTWTAARAECQRHGYELVVVDSDPEYNQLFIGVDSGYGPWAGHTDAAREGEWTSVNGCAPSSRWGRFTEQEPNGGALENCAALGRDGSGRTVLLDAPCDGTVIERILCEQAWTDDPACGPDANLLRADRYIALSAETVDQPTALARCDELGRYPVVFDSAEEYDFVRGLFPPLDFWIGMDDQAVENQWVTATGCPPFLVWSQGEPRDTLVEEDCAAAAADGVHDRPCSEPRYVVCEGG